MSKHSATATAGISSGSSGTNTKPDSPTGSVKKLKNKDTTTLDLPLTDDFVLMSTPDKFKDTTNVNETASSNDVVVKISNIESPLYETINLDYLMLADTSMECAPLHLQTLLQQYGSSQLSQAEIAFLLVYTVALESGYVSLTEYDKAKTMIFRLSSTSTFHLQNIKRLSHLKPSYTKNEDKTRFTMKLYSIIDCESATMEHLYSLLIGIVTGDFLIVTLSPANSTGAKGFSTALSIGRYVLSTQSKNKPIYQRFRKLNELSTMLREQVFMPMRCQQLSWLDFFIYPSLDGMPAELYDYVLRYLNQNQLRILANVNKSLYNLTRNSKYLLISEGTSRPSNMSIESFISMPRAFLFD